jgi:hypothetical protein
MNVEETKQGATEHNECKSISYFRRTSEGGFKTRDSGVIDQTSVSNNLINYNYQLVIKLN